MIEIRHLEHALAVAQYKNFHRAADALFLTQPALTRSIQSLEKHVGSQLFDRGGREVEPTPLGKVFLAHAINVLRESASLMRELELAQGLEVGEINVGASLYAAELVIGPALSQLVAAHPKLKTRLVLQDWVSLPRVLREGVVDLYGGEISEITNEDDLAIKPLSSVRGFVFCRKTHPLSKQPIITVAELLKYPLVCTSLPKRMVDNVQRSLQQKSSTTTNAHLPLIETPLFSMHKTIVAGSNALGLATLTMIENELAFDEFSLLPFDLPELRTFYGIVHLSHRTLSPATCALIDLIVEQDQALQDRERIAAEKYVNW